jgi:hypothetical protein
MSGLYFECRLGMVAAQGLPEPWTAQAAACDWDRRPQPVAIIPRGGAVLWRRIGGVCLYVSVASGIVARSQSGNRDDLPG